MKEMSLDEVHDEELKMLDYFDMFCEERSLTYYLAYGTLLGAVRHRGFIPWDDDVDIWMPRDDFNKLLVAFIETEKYELIEPYSNLFGFGWAKMLCKGTGYSNQNKWLDDSYGLTMDIFPLDIGADEALYTRHKQIDKLRMLAYARPKAGTSHYLSKVALGFFARMTPRSLFKHLCESAIHESSRNGDQSKYVNYFSPYSFSRDSMKTAWFGEGQRCKFRGSSHGYIIPDSAEDLLVNIYGSEWRTPVVNQPHATFYWR